MLPFDIAAVRNGYACYSAQGTYMPLNRLDHVCGSTIITSLRWWGDLSDSNARRYAEFGHMNVDRRAAARGFSVHDYPGRGVAYVLGHGDNTYATASRRLRVWLEGRFLARRCDDEFFTAFGHESE